MGGKFLYPLEDPPTASSSSEDDELEFSSGEDEEQISNSSSAEVKEVLIHGDGCSESSNWFEKSFLVKIITSFGVDEQSVKERWSKVPMESKKIVEEKMKLVQAKEFQLLTEKALLLREVATSICKAIE